MSYARCRYVGTDNWKQICSQIFELRTSTPSIILSQSLKCGQLAASASAVAESWNIPRQVFAPARIIKPVSFKLYYLLTKIWEAPFYDMCATQWKLHIYIAAVPSGAGYTAVSETTAADAFSLKNRINI